jgi:8-oxo-dGTP diphosphatase
VKLQSASLLRLPDGRLILQRRTKDAPTNPGKLGLFGGGVEAGETSEQAARRELSEETNLDTADLHFVLGAKVKLKNDLQQGPTWQLVSIFVVDVPHADFEIYEGDGAESYTVQELTMREDLTNVAKSMLKRMYGAVKQRS